MPSNGSYPCARSRQHLGDEKAQLSVPEHDATHVRGHVDLFEDLERRCERFGEDGGFVGYGVGNPVQVGNRHGDMAGERAVRVEDAHHATGRTVAAEARSAAVTHFA